MCSRNDTVVYRCHIGSRNDTVVYRCICGFYVEYKTTITSIFDDFELYTCNIIWMIISHVILYG